MALGHSVLFVTTLASTPTLTRTNGDTTRSPVCPDERVSIEAALPPNWADEVQRVCLELPSWRNLDPDVRVQLRSMPTTVGIDATSGDGRKASREVHTPQELRLTMKALMTLPAPVGSTPQFHAEPSLEPTRSNALPPNADKLAITQVARPNEVAPLGLHLLVTAMGRVSGAHVYESAGVEGAVYLAVRDWSFGLTARWDALNVTRNRPAEFEMDGIGVGFVVTRRFLHSPDGMSLDGGATATWLTESQSFQNTAGEHTASTTDARLGLVSLARWGNSSLRGAVLLEAELSPGRVNREMQLGPGFPALPTWSAGLGAGIDWGNP
jgi:hypothetical protein